MLADLRDGTLRLTARLREAHALCDAYAGVATASAMAAMAEALDLTHAIHIGHSSSDGEVARHIGRPDTQGHADWHVPPLMLKTEANPAGTPTEAFYGVRAAVAADCSKFRKDPSQQAGAKISECVHERLVASRRPWRSRGHTHRAALSHGVAAVWRGPGAPGLERTPCCLGMGKMGGQGEGDVVQVNRPGPLGPLQRQQRARPRAVMTGSALLTPRGDLDEIGVDDLATRR